MAVGLSTTAANSALTSHTTTYSWVQLHTANPGSAGTTAPAGNTTRKQATWGTAASGSITTTADLVWTSVSTAETYTHYTIWTASTAGTFGSSGALTSSVTVAVGDTFTISTGQLTLSFPTAS